MAQRTGIPTLMEVGLRMCKLITTFSPVIALVTGNSIPVMTALTAAHTACDALHMALQEWNETQP